MESKITSKSGFRQEWVYAGRIVVFTLDDISTGTVDAWAETSGQCLLDWPDEYPFLFCVDFSAISLFTVTPYLAKKTREITALRPDKKGRTAVITSLPPFLTRVIQGFITTLARSRRTRERKLFSSRDEAIAWLKELL